MLLIQQTKAEVLDEVQRRAFLHLHGCPGDTCMSIEQAQGSKTPRHEERLHYLVLAMAGEAGEAANIVKKMWRGDKTPGLHEKLHKEIADTANYAFMIAAHEHMNLLEDMLAALVEYEQRPDAIKPGDDDMHWGGGQPVELRPGLTPIPDNVASILARGMMDEETAKGMARRHIRELQHRLDLLKGAVGDPTAPNPGPDAA